MKSEENWEARSAHTRSGRMLPHYSMPSGPELETMRDKRAPRILLIRVDRIGDALISTPAIELLRQRFPNGTLDLCLSVKNRSVGPLLKEIDQIHVATPSPLGLITLRSRLQRQAYDLSVVLNTKVSRSATLVAMLSGARHSIRYPEYPVSARATRHIVLQTIDILQPITRINSDSLLEQQVPLVTTLQQNSEGRSGNSTPTIGINCSVRSEDRQWPQSNYVELGQRLAADGWKVRYFGAPTEQMLVREVSEASGTDSFPGSSSYLEFSRQLQSCTVVITPDTSTVHLSAALGIPVVGMYADAHTFQEWRPWGVPHRTVAGNGRVSTVSVEQVLQAFFELMKELRSTGPTFA